MGRGEGTHGLDRSRHGSHLFIEMEESIHGSRWMEVGRWNHALEEDLVAGKEWSRPHLPTLSVPALVQLRQALFAGNVMLDVEGATLSAVMETVISGLVTSKLLPADCAELARAALSGADKPGGPRAKGRSLLRPFVPRSDGKDWLRMLEPEKGEEALDLLLAHVPFVSQQTIAFVRLKKPIDAGEHARCALALWHAYALSSFTPCAAPRTRESLARALPLRLARTRGPGRRLKPHGPCARGDDARRELR
jgi:hypothetical protein